MKVTRTMLCDDGSAYEFIDQFILPDGRHIDKDFFKLIINDSAYMALIESKYTYTFLDFMYSLPVVSILITDNSETYIYHQISVYPSTFRTMACIDIDERCTLKKRVNK